MGFDPITAAMGIGTSLLGAESKKSAARAAADKMGGAISSAIGELEAGFEESKGYQQQYMDLGTKATSYFDQYMKPGTLSEMYNQYGKVGDPLYDYYSKKTSESLNRQLAARGRLDSGAALEAQGEAAASLGAQMAQLTDTRVARELGLMQDLLGRGQSAANTVTGMRTTLSQNIANLMTQKGQSDAQAEQAIGDANAGFFGNLYGMSAQMAQFNRDKEMKQLDIAGQQNLQRIKNQATIPQGGAITSVVTPNQGKIASDYIDYSKMNTKVGSKDWGYGNTGDFTVNVGGYDTKTKYAPQYIAGGNSKPMQKYRANITSGIQYADDLQFPSSLAYAGSFAQDVRQSYTGPRGPY